MVNKETVRIIELAKGGVWVEGIQQSACGSCQAKSGCGQHSLSKLGRPVRLWVETHDTFQVDDIVELELPHGSLAISAATLYGLPLLGLVIGAVGGNAWLSETLSLLTGALGLAVGFAAARYLSGRFKESWQPIISRSSCPPQAQTVQEAHSGPVS